MTQVLEGGREENRHTSDRTPHGLFERGAGTRVAPVLVKPKASVTGRPSGIAGGLPVLDPWIWYTFYT